MSFKKKLFLSIGPLFCALLIFAVLIFAPFNFRNVGQKEIDNAKSSLETNVIKGLMISQAAMKEKNIVPFYGSSELSRFDAFHPSVLAEKYDRNYRPFLIGNAGMQSLSHYMSMQALGDTLENKKAVFIVSPQWFVKNGVSNEAFGAHFSSLQLYEFIMNGESDSPERRFAAGRLLEFDSLDLNSDLKEALTMIKDGKEVSNHLINKMKFRRKILDREDDLFGVTRFSGNNGKIDKQQKTLPEKYNFDELDKLAMSIGEKEANNNPYQLKNNFYTNRIMADEAALKDSQKKFNYEISPEFSDFQLILDHMAKEKMQPLFVIPPVNSKWIAYTGLSQEMLDNFTKKTIYQLESQGFQVLDLSKNGNEDYYMEDTIHLGWRGWLEMDQTVGPFLENEQPAVNYQMNEKFYTKEWQNLPISEIDSFIKK